LASEGNQTITLPQADGTVNTLGTIVQAIQGLPTAPFTDPTDHPYGRSMKGFEALRYPVRVLAIAVATFLDSDKFVI
jgi:hypothetical protein